MNSDHQRIKRKQSKDNVQHTPSLWVCCVSATKGTAFVSCRLWSIPDARAPQTLSAARFAIGEKLFKEKHIPRIRIWIMEHDWNLCEYWLILGSILIIHTTEVHCRNPIIHVIVIESTCVFLNPCEDGSMKRSSSKSRHAGLANIYSFELWWYHC